MENKQVEYSDFLPIWKEFLKDAQSVLNVQMVAHHFYNLGRDTAPRELMPTIVKDEQGKVVAVTLTNEEHQLQEVLWQSPRELSNQEIIDIADTYDWDKDCAIDFARAILKKASE
jgi:hypothetical protein